MKKHFLKVLILNSRFKTMNFIYKEIVNTYPFMIEPT